MFNFNHGSGTLEGPVRQRRDAVSDQLFVVGIGSLPPVDLEGLANKCSVFEIVKLPIQVVLVDVAAGPNC